MRRRGLIVVLFPLLVACGLSITGVGPDNDAGSSTSSSSSAGGTEAGRPDATAPARDANAPDVRDARAEEQACLERCAGVNARCVDGVCTLGGTSSDVVRCPAGLACHVLCNGPNECGGGVDCSAAASCVVECGGSGSCSATEMKCGGDSCDLHCTGPNSCTSGASCDARSHCAIACTGANACNGRRVDCTSTVGDCAITCGGGGTTTACASGARCRAGTSCTVRCLGANSCQGDRLDVQAGTDAIVECVNGSTCTSGVEVRARTGDITCGTDPACGSAVRCIAETCTGHCADPSPTLCCPSGSSCMRGACGVAGACN